MEQILKEIDINGRPFTYRKNSHGDQSVMQQIFNNQEYNMNGMAQTLALYAWLGRQKDKPPLIIDAGANIGASAAWYALKFPLAKIIAVEPEHGNYELLVTNSKDRDIITVEAAIGCHSGEAVVTDPGRGDWGFRVTVENTVQGNPVKMMTVRDCMRLATESAPFICKIDIEGSEADLFSSNLEWMEAFPCIIIELHSWMLPGQGSSMNFIKAIARGNWDVCLRGENLFCFNNKLLR